MASYVSAVRSKIQEGHDASKERWVAYKEQKQTVPKAAMIFNLVGWTLTWGALLTLFLYSCVRESFDAAHSGTNPVTYLVLMTVAASLFVIVPIIIGFLDVLVVNKIERKTRTESENIKTLIDYKSFEKACGVIKSWFMGFWISLLINAAAAGAIMGYAGWQLAHNATGDSRSIYWTYIIGVAFCAVGHIILFVFYIYSQIRTESNCAKTNSAKIQSQMKELAIYRRAVDEMPDPNASGRYVKFA